MFMLQEKWRKKWKIIMEKWKKQYKININKNIK